MAGSLKWFIYTTDLGDTFGAFLDESNTEAVNGAAGDLGAGATIDYSLPKNVKPRYARYASFDQTIVRKCVLLSPAATPPASFTDQVSGTEVLLIGSFGEIRQIPNGADTGLLDGDAT